MPCYDYKCISCGSIVEYTHAVSEETEYKCDACGAKMARVFSCNSTGFIIKGGSPAINDKEKRHRLRRREELEKKQREKYPTPKVKPNIAGVETDSWSDAQKMAKEAGLDHESYTPYVEKEKKNKIIV